MVYLQNKLLNGEPFTSNEIGAANTLLNRALPNLTSVTLEGMLDLQVREIAITIKDEAKL